MGFAQPFDNAYAVMHSLMWHKDQKTVSALILAIFTEAVSEK